MADTDAIPSLAPSGCSVSVPVVGTARSSKSVFVLGAGSSGMGLSTIGAWGKSPRLHGSVQPVDVPRIVGLDSGLRRADYLSACNLDLFQDRRVFITLNYDDLIDQAAASWSMRNTRPLIDCRCLTCVGAYLPPVQPAFPDSAASMRLRTVTEEWRRDWSGFESTFRAVQRLQAQDRALTPHELRGTWRDLENHVAPISLPVLQGAMLQKIVGPTFECVGLEWQQTTVRQRLFDVLLAAETAAIAGSMWATPFDTSFDASLWDSEVLHAGLSRAEARGRHLLCEATAEAAARSTFAASPSEERPRIDTITPHGPPRPVAVSTKPSQCGPRSVVQEAMSLAA